MTRRHSWPCIGVAFVAAACAAPPSGEPAQRALSGDASSASTVTNAPAFPSASATLPAAASAPSAPPLGRDHLSVVPCRADAECGWDDTCFPKRCVEPRPASACTESAPPPGECLCIEGACTTKPKIVPVAKVPCEHHGCVVDRGAGTCVADTLGVRESIRTNPGVSVGPSCDCVTPAQGCTFQWFDPIPCKSERDCWVEPSPRRHPALRPEHLKGRDFKPCSDGEVAPKCTEQGFCALGPAYRC